MWLNQLNCSVQKVLCIHNTINSPNRLHSTIAPPFQQSPFKFQTSWWLQWTSLYNHPPPLSTVAIQISKFLMANITLQSPPPFQQSQLKFWISWQLWPRLWMKWLKYIWRPTVLKSRNWKRMIINVDNWPFYNQYACVNIVFFMWLLRTTFFNVLRSKFRTAFSCSILDGFSWNFNCTLFYM